MAAFSNQTLDELKEHVRRHAAEAYPEECCGLIDQNFKPHRCTNVAQDKRTQFRINEFDSKRVTRSGRIAGVYHSHVDQGAYVSISDRAGFTSEGLYLVASVSLGHVAEVQAWYRRADGKFVRLQ